MADPGETSFHAPDARSADQSQSIPIARFDAAYAGGRPPWDIDGPQPAFVRLLDAGAITGRVLDVGCGTGEHALLFASRGLDVVGIDASAIAIDRAAEKARARGLAVRFVGGDVEQLDALGETFTTITDSGCLHTPGLGPAPATADLGLGRTGPAGGTPDRRCPCPRGGRPRLQPRCSVGRIRISLTLTWGGWPSA